MRKQIELLKHHAHFLPVTVDVGMGIGDIHSLKQNLTAGGMLQQVSERRKVDFPETGGADDHHHFSLINLGGNTVERMQLPKGFHQIPGFNQTGFGISDHCCAASFPAD